MDGVSIARRSTTPRPGRCVSASTSRCSPTGRSTTRAGWPAPSTACRGARTSRPPTGRTTWELYNLDEDFSENQDLAAAAPGQAGRAEEDLRRGSRAKYGVYPFDDRGVARLAAPKPPPGGADPGRRQFTYYPGAIRLAETAAPNTKNRSHRISARSKSPKSVATASSSPAAAHQRDTSCTCTTASRLHYNWFDRERTKLASSTPLPAGKSTVVIEFVYDGGGLGKGGEAIIASTETKLAARASRTPSPGGSASTRSASGLTPGRRSPIPTNLRFRSRVR